ncbi:MAG: hypothetical protein HY914_23070 [Desulfomonile tiedjei]|nr:hypothetical protein [Desulfomonile tiedjei]
MTEIRPPHPVDGLSSEQKCKIYYRRVVDLAVRFGLLRSDPDTEIGHFAFSRHYHEGRALDLKLQTALTTFAERFPELILDRRHDQDEALAGVATVFHQASNEEKLRDLILIGATYRVWPVGTSFALTYPWDLEGRGSLVQFRSDLPDFMKRRIVDILKKAGKLQTPNLFEEG